MRDRHATVRGASLEFRFRGKSGIQHTVAIDDRRLAQVVRRCQELPGQELLQYIDDDGEIRDIGSDDVNEYLRAIAGEEFTAKDFRTWAGTVLATIALQEFEAFDSQAQAKRNVVRAIESVARRLGNTPSVCRKCYVHPGVLDAYLEGSMLELAARVAPARRCRTSGGSSRRKNPPSWPCSSAGWPGRRSTTARLGPPPRRKPWPAPERPAARRTNRLDLDTPAPRPYCEKAARDRIMWRNSP